MGILDELNENGWAGLEQVLLWATWVNPLIYRSIMDTLREYRRVGTLNENITIWKPERRRIELGISNTNIWFKSFRNKT